MKKFLFKVVLLSAVILMILQCASYHYKQSPHYINSLIHRGVIAYGISSVADTQSDKIEYTPLGDNLQILNLGSSHGRSSFNYKVVPQYNAFNFGLSSQTVNYDAILLDYYQKKINKNAVVLLPVSYFTLYFNEFEDMEKFEERNVRYYDILDSSHIQNVDMTYYISNTISPLLLLDFQELIEVYNQKDDEFAVFDERKYTVWADVDEQEKEVHFRSVIDHHMEMIGGQVENDRTLQSYKNIFELCNENNFTPILITTPFLDSYNASFNDEFYDKFYSDVYKLSKEHSVLYLDYSHDQRFTLDSALFSDPHHLNESGATKFTNIVIEDLKKAVGLQ